jgi:hypothetical protein
MGKLEFDKNRFRVKFCPCNKDNKDGKFTPYKGYEDKGYCHSCDKTFLPKNEQPQFKCLQVEFELIEDYSERAIKIIQKGNSYYIPKSQIYGLNVNSCFITEWYLLNSKSLLEYSELNYRHFSNENISEQTRTKIIKKQTSYIPLSYFNDSFNTDKNNFLEYLNNIFGPEIANDLKEKYLIGNSKKWNGATVFWQKDIEGNLRTGKVMQYNPTTGERIKTPYSLINWIHKLIEQPDFNVKQCLFGEHLINQVKSKTIAIVESEKTAIIASVYFPNLIWLSVGGKAKLNEDILKPLKGRTIIFFPDINALELWTQKAKELSHFANISICDILNEYANEFESKLDISDYLTQFDFKDFNKPQQQPLITTAKNKPIETFERWEIQIIDLIEYFERITPPATPMKINDYFTITDLGKFVNTNIMTAWSYDGNTITLNCLKRLNYVKSFIEKNN